MTPERERVIVGAIIDTARGDANGPEVWNELRQAVWNVVSDWTPITPEEVDQVLERMLQLAEHRFRRECVGRQPLERLEERAPHLSVVK